MEQVTLMKPTEAVRVNSEQLSGLYADLGDVQAEDIVCRAMEELALRLSHCERLYRAGEFSDLRKSSRSLVAIADQIGMTKLSRIALDVTACIDQEDMVALPAVLARLMRIGEGSLTAIWDLQDVTV